MSANKRIIVAVSILLITPVAVKAEDPVVFADANLKAAVEAALGISNPTPTDMLGLTSLYADRKGIGDLTGLEYAVNLGGLHLSVNNITDISALSGLTNLFHLGLDVNEISNISALSGLKHLWGLRLRSNEISDISVLSGLTNLGELLLSRNPISDISPLSGLTNMMYLELRNISTSDISALSDLSNLRWLWLNGNEINDISALFGLTKITILVLSNNRITDISALSDLKEITQMILINNQISDISPISGLTNLYYLDLRQNSLDCSVYNTVIPMIEENNPGLRYFYYDPIPPECLVISVDVDIKPGSYPNSINLGSKGLIPVAILSSEEFNAITVNPETVELSGAGVAIRGKSDKYLAHEEDVNQDGLIDLIVQVATENLDPDSFQDGFAIVTGTTYDGQDIKGSDEIVIVPPEPEP